MAEPMTPSEVVEARQEFVAAIEFCTSPVHYGGPVSEETFQRDKHTALTAIADEQQAERDARLTAARERPRRDGGP